MTKLPKRIKKHFSNLRDTLHNARTYAAWHPDRENNFSDRLFTSALESLDIISLYLVDLQIEHDELEKTIDDYREVG